MPFTWAVPLSLKPRSLAFPRSQRLHPASSLAFFLLPSYHTCCEVHPFTLAHAVKDARDGGSDSSACSARGTGSVTRRHLAQHGTLFIRGDPGLSLLRRQLVGTISECQACEYWRDSAPVGPCVDSNLCLVDVRTGHHFLSCGMRFGVYGTSELLQARTH